MKYASSKSMKYFKAPSGIGIPCRDGIDEDKFALNYLGQNKYYPCHKINNYTVTNSIKDEPLLEFKPSDLLDNPTNWKNRADINRPWDYIIE